LGTAAGAHPIFVENGRPGPWRHAALLADLNARAAVAEAEALARSSGAGRAARPARPDAPSGLTPMTVDGSEHFLALTLPSPEHPGHRAALALVKSHFFVLEPSNRKWWLRDRHKTLNFLAAHGGRLRDEFGAVFTPNFERHTAHLLPAEVAAEIAPAGDGFAVTLALRAGAVGDAELRSALATSRSYVETDGKIFLLPPARLAQLAAAQQALAGEPAAGLSPRRTQRVAAARIAEADELLEALSPGFQAPAGWRERSTALRNQTALPPAPVPAALAARLRPYQRLGVAWLWHLWRHELGGILADEMGLGKTIQALALLSVVGRVAVPAAASREGWVPNAPSGAGDVAERRIGGNPPHLSLVIAPASLLENWRREAAQFAPGLRVYVHHGEHRLATPSDFAAPDLIITSYGTLARDLMLFATIDFNAVIADEAQHIKNRRSQNATALRSLRARARFLLTGTPLENSLDDLRSLFEFLLPGYLTPAPAGTRGEERAWFDSRLRAQTAPYILRRTKLAVAPELPEKIEQIIWCELTPAQAALYRETQEKGERVLTDLTAAGVGENQLRLAALTQLLRLRQICCDPRLVGAELTEVGRVAVPAVASREGWVPNAPSVDEAGRRVGDNPPYQESAKLDAFRELLAEAVDDGHRILVFSQFTSLLALLRAELEAQGVAHCYLDGAMSTRDRQAEVDRFQATAEVPVFLLSLKAGGTGLNLTGADTVVHFDPWWNPAAEAQATDRAHRIGQARAVTSYKLIAAGTVEEKVLALQAEKRALLADVFDASDAVSAQLSLAELMGLAK
jgi:superfamily II DNA or RNA helicase